MKPGCKLAWIVLFAVAMGYLESSVVVYLRALYYPEGFNFPLKPMAPSVVVTELYREAATLIMILSISVLAAKIWLHRFAWFLLIFGIWDSMYYVFLKLLLDWPESLLTTDILFLLPSIWVGPVLAPLINSATMLLLASVILISRKGVLPITRLTKSEWVLLILGSILIWIAYIKGYWFFALHNNHTTISGEISWSEFVTVLPAQYVPGPFDWMLFGAGLLMHFGAILLIIIRIRPR